MHETEHPIPDREAYIETLNWGASVWKEDPVFDAIRAFNRRTSMEVEMILTMQGTARARD